MLDLKKHWKLSLLAILLSVWVWVGLGSQAWAFCGFYVAKADAALFNQASQVIIAREGDRTVVTLANDYKGDLDEFAIVIPVPVVLQEEQVNVGEPQIIQRLDDFSAPRLVEYYDPDPCQPRERRVVVPSNNIPVPNVAAANSEGDQDLGVTIEAKFSVGEYDILILSAQESSGLETWLNQNGYRIPPNAQPLLQPYIRDQMKFFVAKVNLDEFEQSDFSQLRPLQMAYESPKFMLPIRLGMANAQSDQDLLVYILSPQGQTELTNYRTVKIPSDKEIPVFVQDEFEHFYRDMFQKAYDDQGRSVAFLEYAWNMQSCDPCSAPILTPAELKQAGVFWGDPNTFSSPVFITRLHIRYDRDHFPEDLDFQATPNQEFFQGRYILRHPFTGDTTCRAGREYESSLARRFEQEAQTLAQLTGWDLEEIRSKLPTVSTEASPWWQELW